MGYRIIKGTVFFSVFRLLGICYFPEIRKRQGAFFKAIILYPIFYTPFSGLPRQTIPKTELEIEEGNHRDVAHSQSE